MAARSIEVITYVLKGPGDYDDQYRREVEFLYFPTPFKIEDFNTAMVFTSGLSEATELVMTCEVDKIDNVVYYLDSVILSNLGELSLGSLEPGENLITADGLGRLYSLIDVTERSTVLDITEYFLLQGLEKEILQVYWSDVLGQMPDNPIYNHDLSPQPILR